jgi:AraC family transcriptional activator of pobA
MKSEREKHIFLKLLYWCRDINYVLDDKPHCHPYAQIEINMRGSMRAVCGTIDHVLQAADIILIPPNYIHSFTEKQPADNRETYSFKFELPEHCADIQPRVISNNAFCKGIAGALAAVSGTGNNYYLTPPGKFLIESLLGSVCEYIARSHQKEENAEPDFVTELKKMIASEGKNVNVESAAEYLGISPGHLKYRFKSEYGIPPKQFIDNECLGIIKQRLIYSPMPVGQIADGMNFPDLYAFSRFFKRMTGITATQFRQNANEH